MLGMSILIWFMGLAIMPLFAMLFHACGYEQPLRYMVRHWVFHVLPALLIVGLVIDLVAMG